MRDFIFIVLITAVSCTSMNTLWGFEYYTEDPAVKTDYDRFEGYWSTETTENDLYRKSGHNINSSASVTCFEDKDCNPEFVSMSFISQASDWLFLDHRRLIFLVDGEKHSFSPSHNGQVLDANNLIERMSIQVPADVFEEIAHSENVEARLNSYELDMSFDNREIYRLLSDRLPN